MNDETISQTDRQTDRQTDDKSAIYNYMKVICLLLVVIGHITRFYTPAGAFSINYTNFVLEKITNFIYTFHMPCYMLISGLVYGYCLEKGKYKDNKLFLKNKFVRLILPYLFFGFLYVAPIMVSLRITNLNYFEFCFNGIILSLNSRHLWYLLALFLIFITTIFTKMVYQKRYGFVFLIINLLVFFISSYATILFQIQAVLYYQLYFYIGFVFNKYFDNIIYEIKKKKILFILIMFILLLSKAITPDSKFLSVIYALIGCLLITSLSTLNIFKNCKYANYLNSNSFGIYLFHPMIIYLLFYLVYVKLKVNVNAYIFFIFAFIITMLLSLLLSILLKMTPLKIFIGEKNKK